MCIIIKSRPEFIAIVRIDIQTSFVPDWKSNAHKTRQGARIANEDRHSVFIDTLLRTRAVQLRDCISTIYFTVASVNSYSRVNLGTTEKDSQVEIKDDKDLSAYFTLKYGEN